MSDAPTNETPKKPLRYSAEQLLRLNDDPEFHRRVGSDEELLRLFNPASDQAEIRSELAQALGVGRRIAGVDLAPVTLGRLGLLTVVGSEFAKSERDWSQGFGYQLGQFHEALFVLANGARAVAPWRDCWRHMRALDAWRKEAAMSRAIADSCMEAERKLAESLRTWDAAVMTWADNHVRLEDGETFVDAFAALNDWIAQGLDGWKMFPQLADKPEGGADAKAASPFSWRRKLRLTCARRLARFAQGLILRR